MMDRIAGWLRGGKAPSPTVEARVPSGIRVYAVGDVHGRDDLLRQMLQILVKDGEDFEGQIKLVMIGDYIDRGPASAQVVDILLKELPEAWETVFLRGNHEHAMMEFLKDPRRMPMWLGWGGIQALESYEVKPYGARGMRDLEALAAELRFALEEKGHDAFYDRTVLWHVVGDYAFVHAGVRPRVALEKQMEDDVLFIRDDFLRHPHELPYRVVFGHTIFDIPLMQNDRIGIDSGAFLSGCLTAVALEGMEARFLQALEK